MRFNFDFVVKYRGVHAGEKKITHRVKKYKVRAEDAHRAIDRARELVARDVKLKDLHYPTYTIESVAE